MRGISRKFLHENFFGLSLALIGVLCLTLSAVSYLGRRSFPEFALADGQGLDGPDIEALEKQNKTYERIAQTVTPAVVNIQSTQVVKVQQSPYFNDPFFRQFFGDMFGGVPREQREHALGSGVIVSPDGYIVTNNHVIAHASDIQILLNNKRTFKAKVVGGDPQSDVAVVKVDAKNLPTAPLGDSAGLRVGDTVMAFGNPFGLNFTVTRGSVSALGRSGLGIEAFEDFIQTDTAINPGNSGGALVNIRGQVVGINTAIVPGGQGPRGEGAFIGVGFAIPSNIVKHIMESLIKTGKVSRGYVGVNLEDLNPALARQFNVPEVSGALVTTVEPGSPGDKAGLKQGDVIRTFEGIDVSTRAGLQSMVVNKSPGTEVTLGILRDGKPMTVKMTLDERPASANAGGRGLPGRGPLRGISVQALTPALREQAGVPPDTHGVIINDLDPNSPAAQAGLQPGDVIESINRAPVNSVADFNRLASQSQGEAMLLINRQGRRAFIAISPNEGGDGGDQGGDENQ